MNFGHPSLMYLKIPNTGIDKRNLRQYTYLTTLSTC